MHWCKACGIRRGQIDKNRSKLSQKGKYKAHTWLKVHKCQVEQSQMLCPEKVLDLILLLDTWNHPFLAWKHENPRLYTSATMEIDSKPWTQDMN